jgi:DNA-binding LacI/PurR family transcriptional regulator
MVSQETKERILAAVEVAGYHKNALVRALRTNRTHMAGIIVPEASLSFFTDIIMGAEREAQKSNMRCFLCQSHSDSTTLEQHVSDLREYRVDGVLIVPSSSSIDTAIFLSLQEHGVPFVLIDNPVNGVKAAFVGTENTTAGRLATQHLLALGHRRIACVQGYEGSWPTRYRYEGYVKALADAGVPLDPDLVLKGGFSFEAGQIAVEKLIQAKTPFTAIVTAADAAAIGAIHVLTRHGLRVPQDVSVVGCGNVDMAEMFIPALTTVDQKPEEVGRRAMQLLLQQVNSRELSSQMITIQPSLVVRGSTCPPRPVA